MDKKKKKSDNQASGFSILEVMVSLGLLTVGILGALSLAAGNIGSALYSREQITAFYLAQEAVEYTRNILRKNDAPGYDSNFNQWLNGAVKDMRDCKSNYGCYIDVVNNTVSACGASDCGNNYLKYDSVSKNYYHGSGGISTVFRRWIKIVQLSTGAQGDKEARIDVTVQWDTKGGTSKRVSLQEYVHNFLPE